MSWLSFSEDVNGGASTTIRHKLTYAGKLVDAVVYLESNELEASISVGSKQQIPESRDHVWRFAGMERFKLEIPVPEGQDVIITFTNNNEETTYRASIYLRNVREVQDN